MKKLFLLPFLSLATTLSTIPFYVSCQSDIIRKADGSDWEGVISGIFNLASCTIDKNNKTITYGKESGKNLHFENLIIPNYVQINDDDDDQVYCVLLGSSCFYQANYAIGSIEFNDFIDKIPDLCFQEATRITSVKFHVYPKRIGKSAFQSCPVSHIYVNDSIHWLKKMVYIGDDAFNGSRIHDSLFFDANIEYIGEQAFLDNFDLEYIDLSQAKKITKINTSTFSGLTSLKEVNVHSGLTTFGIKSFFACDSLTTINLPVPGMVLNIGDGAFSDCPGFLRFSKPCRFESIGANAFAGDRLLEQSYWEPEYRLQTVSSFSFDELSISSISISSQGPKEIYDNAFADCEQLTTIDLSDFVYPNYPHWSGINIFGGCAPTGFIILHESNRDKPWIQEFFGARKQGPDIDEQKTWVITYVK